MKSSEGIFFDFGTSSESEWLDRIKEDIEGKNDWEELLNNAYPELGIGPFAHGYNDDNSSNELGNIDTRMSCVFDVEDSDILNAAILQQLTLDIGLVSIHHHPSLDYSRVFNGVLMSALDIEVKASASYMPNIPGEFLHIFKTSGDCPTLHLSRENYLESLSSWYNKVADHDPEEKTLITISAVEDFYLQIAILRAVRIIWNKVNPTSTLKVVFQLPEITTNTNWENALISSSTSMVAGHLGCTDFIQVKFIDSSQLNRLIPMIQHIMTHEAGIHRVSDPLKGSYLIERMTNRIVDIVGM